MGRLRIQLEGSLLWDPTLVSDAIEELFPKIVFKSEQEHMKIMKDNDLTGGTSWFKYRKDNDLEKQGYVVAPWQFFNITYREWFAEIFGERIYKTEQEHIEIIKENKLTGNRQWSEYRKNNKLAEQSYLSDPWGFFNKTAKQFFEYIYGEKKSEQEHINFIKENKITSSRQWRKYRQNNKLVERGYYSYPWRIANKTKKQFFEDIYGEKKTEQEHINFIKENNITCGHKWYKYWRDNNLQNQGYYSNPWKIAKKTQQQFFEDIYGEKKTEQEHVNIIKENNITCGNKWYKYWKNNNFKTQGYLSNPWKYFKKTQKQFFSEIKKS